MEDKNATIKYCAYLRKSSEAKEKQALSLPAQEKEILRSFPDLDIEFVTETRSAFKHDNRPLFSDMLARIKKGERTGLLVWSPDRLSRNELDAAKIVYFVRTGVIEDLKFCTFTFENTPEGIMLLQIALTQSQYDSEKKSRDVKRGLEEKARRGYPSGVAPVGFLNAPREDSKYQKLLVDPDRFPLVSQLLKRFLTGRYSVAEVLQFAHEELKLTTVPRKRQGGGLIARSHIYRILADPIYAGFFFYADERYELSSKLPRAISEGEYWQIQTMLGKGGRPKPSKREGLYNYFMRDSTGGGTTADHKFQLICSACKKKFSYLNRETCPRCKTSIVAMKNPTYLTYIYYQSTKERKTAGVKARAIEERQIDRYLKEYFIENLCISKELANWCIRHVGELHDEELEERQARVRAHEQARSDAQKKLEKLLELRLRSTTLLPEEEEVYDRKEDELRAELEVLKNKSTGVGKDWLKQVQRELALASRLENIFDNGAREEKKEALSVLGSNLTLRNGRVSICNTESVERTIEWLKRAKRRNKQFEPRKCIDTSGRNEVFASVRPTLLGMLDNVRTLKQQSLKRGS